MVLALRGLDVPWFVREGVDIFPGRAMMIQNPTDASQKIHRMEKPGFSVESFAAAAKIPSEQVGFINLTTTPLDFKNYMYMTSQGVSCHFVL